MVNRGSGGPRRPAPPSARPQADEDDAEEKTSAINLADIDLDAIEASPARPAPRPAPPPRAPEPEDFDDDDDEEKTSAINLADINLDAIQDRARPAPPSRPAPAPKARPNPRPPSRPAPPPAATRPPVDDDDDDDDEEKTSALDMSDIQAAIKARNAQSARPAAPTARVAKPPARPAPAQPVAEEKTSAIDIDSFDLGAAVASPSRIPATTRVPAPSSLRAPAAPAADDDDDGFERTMAVSLDDMRPAAPRGADATFLVDDDAHEVKAPPPKRMPGGRVGQATERADAVEAQAVLAVTAGPDAGKSHKVTRDLSLVGRGLDADIVINDASASRRHFNIVKTLHGWKMVDLGSGNGTRVNGSRVKEIALEPGMTIEAGGTTLEWRMEVGSAAAEAMVAAPAAARRAEAPPAESGGEEKTSFADIAALELDPAWETRKAAMRQQHSEEMVPVSGGGVSLEELAAAPLPKSGGGGGKKVLMVGALVAVLGGGFVAADKFGGLGIIFAKDTPSKVTKTDGDKTDGDKTATGTTDDKPPVSDEKAKAKKDAEAAVEAGDKAIGEGRLLAARASFLEAITLDDSVNGGLEGLGETDGQVKTIKALLAAQEAFDSGDKAKLTETLPLAKLAKIDKAYVTRFLSIVAPILASELLGRAFVALEAGKPADAKPLVAEALALSGDMPEIKRFDEAITAALSKEADLRFVEPGEDDGGERAAVPAMEMKPAFEAYEKGDEAALINFVDRIQYSGEASVRDVAKAKAYSLAGTASPARLAEARKKVEAGELDEGFDEFMRAKSCDAILGHKRAAIIEEAMVGASVAFGKAALEAKNPRRAALWFKNALRLKPDEADAKASLEALDADAAELLATAKKAVASDKDAALDAAFGAMATAIPASQTYTDAKALMAELLK